MNQLNTLLFFTGLLATIPAATASSGSIKLNPIGTYASGVYEKGAAEIIAHDPATQRLFVINAQAATVDVLSITNPASPTKIATLSVTNYGAVANSVAVRGGIIAVAVESAPKTANGKVVFFDSNLNFVSQVMVGAQPDMLTFTPNGRFVLTADEGEPNDTYTVDPKGSVSIIDMTGNLKKLDQSKVRTINFDSFANVTLDASVRIFGPGASVAQDIEPEYIAVSHDSKTAYVTCQENNALAIIDIKSGAVTSLKGLGFKDHSKLDAATTIYTFDPVQMPAIGTTEAGQSLTLGGFSGLHFEGIDPVTGRLKFVTHTDRGPNAEPTGILRPFLLPDFTPQIVRFELDRASGQLTFTQFIPLKDSSAAPLTGLPNTAISANANQPHNDEVPVDLKGNVLPLDPLGGDFEGVVVDTNDGTFWMCDEYRPAIYHFDSNGVLLKRFVPVGTAAAAGQPAGTFGDEVLPAVLAQRRQNRGFEGIALDGGKIYAFVQSPLRNPASASNGTLNGNKNIRVVEFNPTNNATRQFIYVMDNANLGGEANTRPDKIGDAVSFGNGEFLVVERDDDAAPADAPATIEKKVYRFNLVGATDVSTYTGTVGATGKTVDQLTAAELKANGIQPIFKMLHVDLNTAGYNTVQKVEGLAIIDPWTLAVINDNDFGVAAITVNTNDGTFTLNYVPENEQLGIIDVRANGLDASDADNKNNIRQWPVKGIYMPDGIASYKIGNQTYLVTANEGDVREWGSYVESLRINSSNVILDTNKFPDAAVLKNNANLGKLNISTASGLKPGTTNVYEELFSFGTRSFSIWDAAGNQVFDSGDDLEWITALKYPTRFNASHTSNSRDNRSDDKGPEPEGVTLGKVAGRDYAFIALERVGGIVVYDVSDPHRPVFVDYVNNRDFNQNPSLPGPVSNPAAGDLGPEGIIFIKEDDSPTGKPLVIIGNEVSGTTTVFEITRP